VQGSSDLHAKGSEWANTGAERENLSDFALHKNSAFEIHATLMMNVVEKKNAFGILCTKSNNL
jgi:hypothetical protein